MRSGWINEEVRTIIPSWARAEIDVRLVKESRSEKTFIVDKKTHRKIRLFSFR